MKIGDWCAEEARAKLYLVDGSVVEGKLLSQEDGLLFLRTFAGKDNAIPLAVILRLERLADPACGAQDY